MNNIKEVVIRKPKKNAEKILKEFDLKVTKRRKEFLEFLLKFPETAFSIDEIVSRLKVDFDRVTAYRIIEAFSEKGILQKVSLFSNIIKVIISPKINDSHKHLISCRFCGITFTTSACVQEGWRDKISKLGFKDISHNLTFSGVCQNH